jgi:uncharacterized paraquat-inducible protein A
MTQQMHPETSDTTFAAFMITRNGSIFFCFLFFVFSFPVRLCVFIICMLFEQRLEMSFQTVAQRSRRGALTAVHAKVRDVDLAVGGNGLGAPKPHLQVARAQC